MQLNFTGMPSVVYYIYRRGLDRDKINLKYNKVLKLFN